MKILYLGIIIGIAIVFATVHLQKIEAECANEQDGLISCSEVDFKAAINKLIYENSEHPLISVSGTPGKILSLTVLDDLEHQKLSDAITIGQNGTTSYPLDVTSYPYGIYQAMIGDSTGKVILNFPVELKSSGSIQFYTDKDHYNAGDTIIVSGSTTPSKYVQILLIDPNLLIQYKGDTHSNSAGHFVFNLSLPQFAKSGYWKIRATSEANDMILPIPVGNTEDATYPADLPSYTYKPGMPLQQLKSGIAADDILCKSGLQPVIPPHGGVPACVRPQTVQVLIARGWTAAVYNPATAGTVTDLSAFKLNLSTDDDVTSSGQQIGIDISFNNTSSIPLKLMAKDSWSYPSLSLGEQCGLRSTIGIAILHGYYTEQNMTQGKTLPIFGSMFAVSCAIPTSIQSYVFEPSSSHAYESSCNNVGIELSCGGFGNEASHLEINGTWDDGKIQPFEDGIYTLIGGDEWGHLAIKHFTVANSAETYTTSISQPTTVQTNDLHGTINDIAVTTPFTELASSSSGIQIARGGCCSSYDNDSIKLELYHGKRSGSDIIAATVDNVGKRTVHVYGIRISGFIQFTNSSGTLNLMVLEDEPDITPKEDAILEPGGSQTKYIVGNWTGMGRQVNGFSTDTSYSYDDLENYNGMTNGYDMTVPVQWIQQ